MSLRYGKAVPRTVQQSHISREKRCDKCERFSEGSLSKRICVFSGKNTCHGFVRRGCTRTIVVSKCGITKCAALEFMISPCFYELGQNKRPVRGRGL